MGLRHYVSFSEDEASPGQVNIIRKQLVYTIIFLVSVPIIISCAQVLFNFIMCAYVDNRPVLSLWRKQ